MIITSSDVVSIQHKEGSEKETRGAGGGKRNESGKGENNEGKKEESKEGRDAEDRK